MTTSKIRKIKIAVIIFYLALFTGLALYDEKPNPEMVKEMSRHRPETIEPSNAWIAFLGFNSPAGTSPYTYGKEKMLKISDMIQKGKNIQEIVAFGFENKSEFPIRGDIPWSFPFYSEKNKGMLPYAILHSNEIIELLRNNDQLLQRYESLYRYPRYTEPLDYGFYAPFPKFAPIRSAQRLKHLKLALKASQGDIAGALAGIRED